MISLLASIALSFQNPNAIEGVWMVESEDAYIKIFEDDGKFFGRVTWLKEPYDENGDPITDDEGNPIQDMEFTVFNFYIENFSRYNALYGSIGTLLIFLLWIYFNSNILLIGFELNASIKSAKLEKY